MLAEALAREREVLKSNSKHAYDQERDEAFRAERNRLIQQSEEVLQKEQQRLAVESEEASKREQQRYTKALQDAIKEEKARLEGVIEEALANEKALAKKYLKESLKHQSMQDETARLLALEVSAGLCAVLCFRLFVCVLVCIIVFFHCDHCAYGTHQISSNLSTSHTLSTPHRHGPWIFNSTLLLSFVGSIPRQHRRHQGEGRHSKCSAGSREGEGEAPHS